MHKLGIEFQMAEGPEVKSLQIIYRETKSETDDSGLNQGCEMWLNSGYMLLAKLVECVDDWMWHVKRTGQTIVVAMTLT